MKKLFFCLALLLTIGSQTSLSQIKQGSWEFSTSGMMGSLSTNSEAKNPQGSVIQSSTWNTKYITLALRAGYYAVAGLAIEPEVLFSAIENWSPIYILSANIAYNHSFPDAHITPFVLAGYGVGNSTPSLIGAPLVIGRFSNKLDIPVLQLGLGMKYHVGEHVAIRTEYRYQRYSIDQDAGMGFSYNNTFNYNNILIGISLFLY